MSRHPSAAMSEVVETLRDQILLDAAWALGERPVTITATPATRSAGGPHDFFSEADYWWPDPADPAAPYVLRDGESNPANFVAHRHAMIRFSRVVGALASAYGLERDDRCVAHAMAHVRAWFVDPATMMSPTLSCAQAVRGRARGTSFGIIDTIHLVEVTQGLLAMEQSPAIDRSLLAAAREWFAAYLTWLTSDLLGLEEREATNNHASCWVMQVACFARFTGDADLMSYCRGRYRDVLLVNQMAADGSFPLELARTKPYSYSLFNLDAMATICQTLSDDDHDLWRMQTSDGRSIATGIEYLFPYMGDKGSWPHGRDVLYWEQWPVAHPFLLFGGIAEGNRDWVSAWRALDHAPRHGEVIRNLPVRNPLIWLR